MMAVQDSHARWLTFLTEYYSQDIQVLTSGWPEPKYLIVEFSVIQSWDPEFAQSIIDYPRHILQAGREALIQLCEQGGHEISPQLRVVRLPSYSKKKLRSIGSENIEKFVSAEVVVTKISELKPRIYEADFRCAMCQHVTPITQLNELELNEPVVCDETQGGCNRTPGGRGEKATRFDIIHEGMHLIDNQWIEVQELPEQVDVGTPPARAMLLAEEDLANSITPGMRLTVNVIPFIRTEKKRNTKTPMFDVYYSLKSVEKEQSALTEIKISEEDEKEIKTISKRADLYELMRDSIAPSVLGTGPLNRIKLSLVYQLFGGEARKNRDGTRIRGDIHILMVGDPGVAKSQLLKFMGSVTPRGHYATGGGVTGAGLTAAVVRDSFSDGRFSLEAGVLPLSDMGLAAIDEFDKMAEHDRGSMHLAMEQQMIHISKGGLNASMRTRCAVLAAANPKNSRWNARHMNASLLECLDEVELGAALLTRFDIIWLMRDDVVGERDKQIAQHILDNRTTGVSELLIDEATEMDPTLLDKDTHYRSNGHGKDLLTVSMLQKYIAYARRFVHPALSEDAKTEIRSFYNDARQKYWQDNESPITPRAIEAVSRLAEARARVRLSDSVDVTDATEAIAMYKHWRYEGDVDDDSIATGKSRQVRQTDGELMGLIRNISGGRRDVDVSEVDIYNGMSKLGYSDLDVENSILRLSTANEVYTPGAGRWRLTN